MKKIHILTLVLLLVFSLALFTACGGENGAEGQPANGTATHENNGGANAADSAAEQPRANQNRLPVSQEIIGEWFWEGELSSFFNADGTGKIDIDMGTDFERGINWWAADGVLFICIDPDCDPATCDNPREWYYSISGDVMTLTNPLSGMYFIYTRG